jgi:N-acyl-D-glutamate deacylase
MFIDKTNYASRRSGIIFIGVLFVLISFAIVLTAVAQGQLVSTFDLVLIGGRVMDPESGLDAARNIGVNGGRVSAIG